MPLLLYHKVRILTVTATEDGLVLAPNTICSDLSALSFNLFIPLVTSLSKSWSCPNLTLLSATRSLLCCKTRGKTYSQVNDDLDMLVVVWS